MKSLASVSLRLLQALIIIVVGFGPLVSSASLIRHDREADQYRELGKLRAFQCVVRMGVKPLGHPVMFGGSAVLIAPQWVLTAGQVGMKAPLKRLRFQFGDEEYRATRVVPHPGFMAVWKKDPMVVVGGDPCLNAGAVIRMTVQHYRLGRRNTLIVART